MCKLVGIVTDGMPSVIGSKNGMVSLYKHMHKLGLQMELIQDACIIHQSILIDIALGFEIIITDVSAVNFIKSHGLIHRQSNVSLDEIESENGNIVYCEVHWLSKDKVLQHFLSLLKEIKVFFIEKGQPVSHSEAAYWVCGLAFLMDICGHLNDLNSKLRGKCQLVSELYNNVSAFQMRLPLFHLQILNNNNNTCHFPGLQKIF
jgi:hypothetical protein